MQVAILCVLIVILVFVLAIYGAINRELTRRSELDDRARRMEHSR